MPSYNGKLIAAAIVSFAIISAVPSTDVHADDAETRAQDMASPFTNEIYSTPKSLVKKEKFIGSLGLDKLPDDLAKKLPDANFGGVFVRPGHNPGLEDSSLPIRLAHSPTIYSMSLRATEGVVAGTLR